MKTLKQEIKTSCLRDFQDWVDENVCKMEDDNAVGDTHTQQEHEQTGTQERAPLHTKHRSLWLEGCSAYIGESGGTHCRWLMRRRDLLRTMTVSSGSNGHAGGSIGLMRLRAWTHTCSGSFGLHIIVHIRSDGYSQIDHSPT